MFSLRVFLIISLIGLQSYALQGQRWKTSRQEIIAGIGATNFIGELGGADVDGNLNFIRNLNISDSRPAFTAAYRYRLSDLWSVKAGYYYGLMHGDDAKTENIYRNTRNLNFRTPVHELGIHFELNIIPDKSYRLFQFRGGKKSIFDPLSMYLFTGVSGIYFNPKGELNGEWHNLRTLGTEGQGLIPGTDFYSPLALVIPYGIGIKIAVTKRFGLNAEYGSRLTFTDYIDDVSTNYYDNDALRASRGNLAADLADKNPYTERQSWTSANQQRGNPESNDFYLFGTVSIYYKLLKNGEIKPKF